MPKEKPQPLVAAKRAKVEGAFVITDNGNAEFYGKQDSSS